jgi:hypothetical protein
MTRSAAPLAEETSEELVAAYKRILAAVLDRRPSGTRQRLAAALGKNRSFITQISNPAYSTPIPSNHVDIIFEICHFSPDERLRFTDAYGRAHPRRPAFTPDAHKVKPHTIYLPDLGDDDKNARLHTLVADFVRQVARMFESEPSKGKRS